MHMYYNIVRPITITKGLSSTLNSFVYRFKHLAIF